MTTIIREVDPVSRIEGHLGLKLTIDNGTGGTSGWVSDCDAHGNLWRGFENFLIDRQPNDAITFTQRICGVCPLPHATASTFAVDSVFGHSDGYITFASDGLNAPAKGVPKKAVHIRNIVYAAEFLMSSITHFYHLAAISYVQGPPIPPWTPYFDDNYYHPFLKHGTRTYPDDTSLWSAIIKQYVKALRIRRLTFEAAGMFAGRMPMTSSFVAGGVTYDQTETASNFQAKCDAMFGLLKEVGDFIIKEYVPLVLALGALFPNYDNYTNATTLNSLYPDIWAAGNQSDATSPTNTASGNTGWGAGCGNFLAWGAFPQPHVANQALAIGGGWLYGQLPGSSTSGRSDLCTGVANVGAAITKVKARLVEDISHSRYASGHGYTSTSTPAYPGDVTRTEPHRSNGYSWLKAPRWDVASSNFQPMEVGPLARLAVNGLYPVDGRTLVSVVDLPSMSDYASYASGGALDARMIDTTLMTGLQHAGKNSTGSIIVNGHDYKDADISGIVTNWILALRGGLSTMDRLRARALESLYLVQCMIGAYNKTVTGGWPSTPGGWLGQLRSLTTDATYSAPAIPVGTASGFGVSEAPRGALAHFISVTGNKITAYQCVVPTTWNGSPKDHALNAGPIEQAVIGTPYKNRTVSLAKQVSGSVTCDGGVEALRVAQSFDPCIACSVH